MEGGHCRAAAHQVALGGEGELGAAARLWRLGVEVHEPDRLLLSAAARACDARDGHADVAERSACVLQVASA